MFDFMEGEVVDDYAIRIRHARMEKGLSQKDLAMQMKEKEHLIKKIENGELIPEDAVRKKLEIVLEIRLIDAPAEVESREESSRQSYPYTGGSHHYPESEEITPLFFILFSDGTHEWDRKCTG